MSPNNWPRAPARPPAFGGGRSATTVTGWIGRGAQASRQAGVLGREQAVATDATELGNCSCMRPMYWVARRAGDVFSRLACVRTMVALAGRVWAVIRCSLRMQSSGTT